MKSCLTEILGPGHNRSSCFEDSPPIPAEGEARLWRWVGSQDDTAYEYCVDLGRRGAVAGTLYLWSITAGPQREVFHTFAESVAPDHIMPCIRDGGFVSVKLVANGDSMVVAHRAADMHVERSRTLPTIAALLQVSARMSNDVAFSPGPPEAAFTLKHRHSLVLQLAANGIYVIDLDRMKLNRWLYLADASAIGLEIGQCGEFITGVGGDTRLAIWRSDSKDGEETQ